MENKKNNTFKEFISPVLVLVIICFAVTLILSFAYGITSPIIEKNAAKAAAETRTALLESAEGQFEEYSGDLLVYEKDKVYVKDWYKASNGSGVVITACANSYGGTLTAMIGIDKDGAITAVKVTEASDTPGVGDKAQKEGHLAQYKGLDTLTSDEVKKDGTVQAVTGASVSSGAIHKAVYCALEQFKEMGGVK